MAANKKKLGMQARSTDSRYEIYQVQGEVKTLTGGPLGPMIDRPGSPGAPYRQKDRKKTQRKIR